MATLIFLQINDVLFMNSCVHFQKLLAASFPGLLEENLQFVLSQKQWYNDKMWLLQIFLHVNYSPLIS